MMLQYEMIDLQHKKTSQSLKKNNKVPIILNCKNLIAQYAATLENNPNFAAEVARNALRRAELLKGILTPSG